MVSHDLRNPLNVAKIRLDIARDEGACDSEHLAGVQEAHERMESLIDDLLRLARTGNEITEVEHIDLAELSQMCWQTVATDSATLDVSTDCTIKADRSRLKQLLENVIRNAVEHGGASVTVTVGEIEGDGIYIEDDGSGIGDTDPADLFAHGYSTVDDGNGLGLAIVSEIADAHGWTVSMTESGDGGARVEITDMEFA
jgi:signal transduction histidine kinase